MYIRVNDVESVPKAYKIRFQNKLQKAAELVKWDQKCCKRIGKELWIVTDGGFTRASFLKPLIKTGIVVITRLRKSVESSRGDVVLYAEIKQTKKRKRGRPRKYGKRIILQNVVNNPDGWFNVKALLYGKEESRDVRVFKALYKPAGCLITSLVN
jgi:hypothetical protein